MILRKRCKRNLLQGGEALLPAGMEIPFALDSERTVGFPANRPADGDRPLSPEPTVAVFVALQVIEI